MFSAQAKQRIVLSVLRGEMSVAEAARRNKCSETSIAGALEARDVLHKEDLKQPCLAACAVAPREYEFDEIPDSAAVHHAPVRSELPRGLSPVEAYHAEFVIGPRLYVVQADGPPSSTFGAEFHRVLQTVYEAASNG